MAYSHYSLENKEIRSLPTQLLYVTHSKFEHDWPSLLHTHHFAELCYIIKGTGSFLIEEELHPVKRNDLIIVNANIAHTEMSEGSDPLEYIVIGINGLTFSTKDSRDYLIFNCQKDYSDFLYFMNILLKEMEQKRPDYELICKNILEILIVKLARRNKLSVQSGSVIKSSHECFKLKQYIDSNFTQDITLDTLAQKSHLNKYYLVHEFTKQFGCSPINYLCDVRLQTAKELLSSTNLSITDVAHSSGFSSLSYFAQAFRKHCGMSASAYRKQSIK